MRRLLLLAALLAMPALARGQLLPPAAGGLSFGTDLHSVVDNYINLDECSGRSPGTLLVRWDVGNASSTATADPTSFSVYAHNVTGLHTASSAGACPHGDGDGNDTSLKAGIVGKFAVSETNPNGWNNASNEVAIDPAAVVTWSGNTCEVTLGDKPIVLCVEADNGATARGTVTLSTQPPRSPTGVVAGSGSGAVNVDFTASTGSPEAEYYIIEAAFTATTAVAPNVDPATIDTLVTSGALTATTGNRLSGLVDGVLYTVRVYAFSTADNRSAPSEGKTVMPELARDFWNAYHGAGGREQGGCGVGTAGPIGLLVAAAALALARRRS